MLTRQQIYKEMSRYTGLNLLSLFVITFLVKVLGVESGILVIKSGIFSVLAFFTFFVLINLKASNMMSKSLQVYSDEEGIKSAYKEARIPLVLSTYGSSVAFIVLAPQIVSIGVSA